MIGFGGIQIDAWRSLDDFDDLDDFVVNDGFEGFGGNA